MIGQGLRRDFFFLFSSIISIRFVFLDLKGHIDITHKTGKSAGVDNIPAELVQAGREDMIDILTSICNKTWKTGERPTTRTQSQFITLPKKGNLQLCQNYRTISFISHPSKVMLKIILNSLQPEAEEFIAEAQQVQSRKEHHRTNIQSQDPLWEIPQYQQNLYNPAVVVSYYWRRASIVLVNRLEGLSLPRIGVYV